MAERQYHRNMVDINAAHTLRYKFARKHLKETDNVMDYGCGCGYGTHFLAPYCKAIIGVDKSKEAWIYAKKYYTRHNLDYILSDSPLSDNKFDLIIAFEVVEHVKDSLKLLQHFYQSLTPNGKLILSVPNQEVVPFDKIKYEFHYRHFTKKELEELLEKSGFKKISRHYQLSKFVPTVMKGEWIGYTSIALCEK